MVQVNPPMYYPQAITNSQVIVSLQQCTQNCDIPEDFEICFNLCGAEITESNPAPAEVGGDIGEPVPYYGPESAEEDS
jgi:hypothetical protein